MRFYPAPGTFIAEEIKSSSAIFVGEKKTRILKAKVIAVGPAEITDYGIVIEVPVKAGDIAHFLSYEGEYDLEKVKGKFYYTVLRKDLRFITHDV